VGPGDRDHRRPVRGRPRDPVRHVALGQRRSSTRPVTENKMATEPMLKLSAVAKVFHTDEVETHALANVYLEVGKGEFLSINGPSGSGKSTLLAILGLLDTPTRGEYRLGSEIASDLSPARRAQLRNREIGFIFQA